MEYKIGRLMDWDEFFDTLKDFPIVNKKEYIREIKRSISIEYINLPASFDIEVSSFYYNEVKMSCMYIWQFGINGNVVIGRTWEEFEQFCDKLVIFFGLNSTRRLPVYVHNLQYEFQFIKNRFKWLDIFAREKRSPMKALTSTGIEFRCSYMLSGCSLEQTCKDLTKYKMEKKVGDLDYDKMRFPITPLTDKELGYCIYDVIGVMCFIQEEMEKAGDITKIPMTKTGKVRNYCREKCFSEKNAKAYRATMAKLTIDGAQEYNLLKDAFQAGYTHANWLNANEVFTDVYSEDFTSSYPSVMVCEKMPMTKGQWVINPTIKQVEDLIKADYYVVFKVQIEHIEEKPGVPDHYISLGRCKGVKNAKSDNGRLISADRIQTTITSDDWIIIKKAYNFKKEDVTVGACIRYGTAYLPTVFVQCVLDFYRDKTTLKDVPGMEAEYQGKKGMLNSTFGCSVTDIVCDEIEYDDEWISNSSDVEEAIKEYNNSKNRFLFYPWGIAICSKARKNLWKGILELGDDYIYSDTDSVKFINYDAHKAWFEEYNKQINNKMEKACQVMGLNIEDTRPKTVKGKEKPLGVWDFDGHYLRFKTLGAKRYLVENEDHSIKCTIAGANKKQASIFISEQEDPFEFFNDKMCIDEEHSGRLVHTYLDSPFSFEVKDYLGNDYKGTELSGIHMSKSEYNLKLSPIYSALLNQKEIRYH